ncbi:MAG: hypothetical protein M3143_10275, partial [Actinomycetota bacterium]|nr:hypothetical protein [Actinomycetota bacterium]
STWLGRLPGQRSSVRRFAPFGNLFIAVGRPGVTSGPTGRSPPHDHPYGARVDLVVELSRCAMDV